MIDEVWRSGIANKNEVPFQIPFHNVSAWASWLCTLLLWVRSQDQDQALCVYLSGGRWRSSCHNIAHRRNTTSPSVTIVMMRLMAAPGTVLSSAIVILTWSNLARASQARPGSRHHSNWLLSDYLLQPGSMRNVLPKNDLNSGPLQPTARQGGAQADQGPLHLTTPLDRRYPDPSLSTR